MTVYHTISLARAGKTTWCNKFVRFEADIKDNYFVSRANNFRRMQPNENPRVSISEDAIMLSLTGKRFTHNANPMVKAVARTMIRAFMNDGYDILVDDTFTTLESIEQLLWICEAAPVFIFKPHVYYDGDFGHLIFDNEKEWDEHVELCCLRARDTNQHDLIDVIQQRHAPQLVELVKNWDQYLALRDKINKERK